MTTLEVLFWCAAGTAAYLGLYLLGVHRERAAAWLVGACGDIAWKAGRMWHRLRVRDSGRRG